MNLYHELAINPEHGTSIIFQLKEQITWLIASGKLTAGEQLPPIKEMAKGLGINLQTVRIAYLRLEADGLVSSHQGRGTHVLAFDPSQFARLAASQHSHTIGVVLPSMNNPFYQDVLQGVEDVAEENGMLILLTSAHEDPHHAWRNFAMLAAKGVDGILLFSHDVSQYLESFSGNSGSSTGIPFVSVDAPASTGFVVNMDLQAAGRLAARHILSHAHDRIGVITFDPRADVVKPLIDGFIQEVTTAGKIIQPGLMGIVPDFSMEAGASVARMLMSTQPPPTAVFAIADMLAFGAMQTFKRLGLRIPADVALVSFNNVSTASLVEPGLTTVSAPALQLGREGMRMLKILMDGNSPKIPQVLLPVELIIRGSCGVHLGEQGR
jgi:DNA-binding LacI/PurR family transcriptional regulator